MDKTTLRMIYRQIDYISKNGCKDIKCRKCVMNKVCDRFPSHSQFIALKALEMINLGQ